MNSEIDTPTEAVSKPVLPKHLQDDTARKDAIVGQATNLAETVRKTTSEIAVDRTLSVIGLAAQEKLEAANLRIQEGAKNLTLNLEGENGVSGVVPRQIAELSAIMTDLNPHSLTNSRWFRWAPTRIKRWMTKRFSQKFQTEKEHVDTILNGLRAGRDTLHEENISLEGQYDTIGEGQREIAEQIYLCELTWEALTQQRSEATDVAEQRKLDIGLNKVARRSRDLHTIVQANEQFKASIGLSVQANTLLVEQTNSVLVVAPSVLTHALQINRSLRRQKEVADAVQQSQKAMGDIMVANAHALNQQTDQIAALYNNPVIALDQLTESRDILMAAIVKADNAVKSSTARARQVGAQLATMSVEMKPIADSTMDGHERTGNPKSLPDSGSQSDSETKTIKG